MARGGRRKRRRALLWAALGALLLLVIGAAVWAYTPAPMTALASEGWSRGSVMGQTPVKRRVALQPSPEGGMLLLWPNLAGELEIAHIGPDGAVVSRQPLPLDTRKPRDPQLAVGHDGRLHLLWFERGASPAELLYAVVDADGTPATQPRVLSTRVSRILDVPCLVGAGEYLHALWVDEEAIHWTVVDREGKLVGELRPLIPEGRALKVQPEGVERLHLLWRQPAPGNVERLNYAALDLRSGDLTASQEVAEVVLTGRLNLVDMALGLSSTAGYVFWSEYDQGFDRYRFQYVPFPLAAPERWQTRTWSLQAGDGPLSISPLDGRHDPLRVALSERVMGSGREPELQISLISVGQADEQLVTATDQASVTPVVVADAKLDLHLAWLETAGFGEYNVVYASTSTEVIRNYNAVTPRDVVDAMFTGVFQAATLVIPFVASLLMWAVAPLVGLAIYHLVTSEEVLDTGRSYVALGAALVVEVVLSFLLPPRFGIQASWPALRWVAPAASAAVTALAMAGIIRRRPETNLFAAFLLFTVVNTVFQLLLYLLV